MWSRGGGGGGSATTTMTCYSHEGGRPLGRQPGQRSGRAECIVRLGRLVLAIGRPCSGLQSPLKITRRCSGHEETTSGMPDLDQDSPSKISDCGNIHQGYDILKFVIITVIINNLSSICAQPLRNKSISYLPWSKTGKKTKERKAIEVINLIFMYRIILLGLRNCSWVRVCCCLAPLLVWFIKLGARVEVLRCIM